MRLAIFIVLTWLLSTTASLFAQTTDEQLAAHYYQEGDFEKAVMYYEKLYDNSPNNTYYRSYLSSLLELERYKDAEKLVKRDMKRHDFKLTHRIDLGEVYEKSGNQSLADKEYERAIKDLGPSRQEINSLASTFTNRNKLEYALLTYQKGKKLLKGTYPYALEIANIYGMQGDHELMIAQYLDLLAFNEAYLRSVQNSLSRTIDFTKENDKNEHLRVQLLKRIQKNPGRPIFSEVLIWMFIQLQDFNSAIIQSKAMDKRGRQNGMRLIELGGVCASNNRFEEAIECYQYVIDKGPDNMPYSQAKMELLNTLNRKITGGYTYTQEDLLRLESNYISTLDELGRTAETAEIMLELGHLQAFYIHDTEKAIAQLEQILNIPNIQRRVKAMTKLELGDILVLSGSIWDAALYYGQVEKDFKHDVLGHEAKFRTGRIYYFSGDFGWAQSYLDVLKGSTSKLISNDAIDLSLLITDNTGLDSNPEPMLMFARADLLKFQNKFEEASGLLDSIKVKYPRHMLEDEILYRQYEIAFTQRDYSEAKSKLEAIQAEHGDDILGDDALFKLAEMHELYLNEPEKAKSFYRDLLTNYSNSLYATEARKRFRKLRGDKIEDGNTIEREIK